MHICFHVNNLGQQMALHALSQCILIASQTKTFKKNVKCSLFLDNMERTFLHRWSFYLTCFLPLLSQQMEYFMNTIRNSCYANKTLNSNTLSFTSNNDNNNKNEKTDNTSNSKLHLHILTHVFSFHLPGCFLRKSIECQMGRVRNNFPTWNFSESAASLSALVSRSFSLWSLSIIFVMFPLIKPVTSSNWFLVFSILLLIYTKSLTVRCCVHLLCPVKLLVLQEYINL